MNARKIERNWRMWGVRAVRVSTYERKKFPGWSEHGTLGLPMAYLTRIHVENCRNVKDLDVDLSPNGAKTDEAPESSNGTKLPFRNLILTGPNGSGKSGVLEAVLEEIRRSIFPDPQMSLPLLNVKANSLQWSCADHKLPQYFTQGDLITVYLPARRKIRAEEVRGPLRTKKRKPEELLPAIRTASSLRQFMVNKHVDMTYARTNRGDHETADRIERWFDGFVEQMRRITEDDKLSMTFDPHAFEFTFYRGDGYGFDLSTLADGYAAILALLAELFIRIDTVQLARKNFMFVPEGVVLVDEIETHLHLSLQEKVLPFLTQLFPRFQFIVATHSPAVIASIPDAVVYDLRKQKQFLSSDYQGIPYGMLMTEHFGISSDIDLDSTSKLLRFRTLAQQATRTSEDEREMEQLATVLSSRSKILATEVWMVKEHLGLSSVQLAGE